jgi:hypothetical protein
MSVIGTVHHVIYGSILCDKTNIWIIVIIIIETADTI